MSIKIDNCVVTNLRRKEKMVNQKRLDLRIQRTQKAIIDAFYELLDEKSFSSITVIDICSKALINRGTFYTHFEDKYQLLDKCISDIMYDFDSQVDSVHGNVDMLTYYTEVTDLCIKFLSHCKKRLRTILRQTDNALIFDKVQEILIHNLMGKLAHLTLRQGKEKIKLEVLAQFFTGGVVKLAQWWLLDENDLPTSFIREQLTALLKSLLVDFFSDADKRIA